MEPTDFKNYNYRKLRLDARWDGAAFSKALSEGWMAEEDKEFARFKAGGEGDPICIVTFSRKKGPA